MTEEYNREGRLDANTQTNLVELVTGCHDTLSRLDDLKRGIERWGLQRVREDEVLEMTTALDDQIRELSVTNTNIVYYMK